MALGEKTQSVNTLEILRGYKDFILNPDSTPRFCTYGYGDLTCTASEQRIIPQPTDRWIYKTKGSKKDHYDDSNYY